MKLTARLAKELVKPLSTLLVRTAFGDVAATATGGLLNIAEQVGKDYYDQQEIVRQFQRMAEKIVQRLEPRYQQAIDQGGIDVDKVAGVLGHVLDREASAAALLKYNMQPQQLAAAWDEANPDRWGDFNADERQLYEAALADAARYLVEVASELPGFQSRFAGRVVQHLQSLTDDLDRIFVRVDDVERWVRGKGLDDERSRFEADYRRAVLRRFDYMELLGADIPVEARRHPLSVAYVSLSLLAPGDAEGQDEDDGIGISRPFEAILDQLDGRRLLVRGEAGSGKSTLFRWSALQAGKPEAESPQETGDHWRSSIPFLIRLRDYPDGRLPPVFDLPGEVAKNVGSPPVEWVRELFEGGKALLLFDGVDEVPNQRRDDVRQEMENIIAAYPRNFYLVSTRPAAVPDGWLAGAEFQEATINPMSAADRALFVRKWHDAVREQLRRDKRVSEESSLEGLADRLTAKLNDNPAIAHLATNPLLCGMVCALHRERQEQLPETQVELCEDLCKILLHRREKESGVDTVRLSRIYSQLNYEQKRGVVQELAHYMVRNGQSSVGVEQADRCFAEALRRFPGSLANQAADIRQGFVERSGLLREPEPSSIDFVHNTIKEYLAGDRFAQLGDTGPLVEHALDPAWQPTIFFAAGSRVVGFADRLIERLLDDGGMVGKMSKLIGWRGAMDTRRARMVFAVRCGGDALHLSEENRRRLNAVLEEGCRPESLAESEGFAALGDFVVPFLPYEPRLSAKSAVAAIRTLQIIGTAKAKDCLAGYAVDRRKSVVAEFRQATDHVNSIGMRMRLISPGQFRMGSNEFPREQPIHNVQISKTFLLGVFPVTQEEYQQVTGLNPSHFKGNGQNPVEGVSWFDAVTFCNRLSEMERREPLYRIENGRVEIRGGGGYRLPTEAEWEYACRAGSTNQWYFGNDEQQLTHFAWYHKNSHGKTHPVGQKKPNAWGFHDMHGNVWEWCADWFDEQYYSQSPQVDPTGPNETQHRVIRGASWGTQATQSRTARREWGRPDGRGSMMGFRLALVPSSQQAGNKHK